jgi:lipopolysaccharide assembly outer membrane protein LptD (OstA)
LNQSAELNVRKDIGVAYLLLLAFAAPAAAEHFSVCISDYAVALQTRERARSSGFLMPAPGKVTCFSSAELVDDPARRQVIARGNVKLDYSDRVLTADEIAYDAASGQATARGRVRLQRFPRTDVHAQQLILPDDARNALLEIWDFWRSLRQQ